MKTALLIALSAVALAQSSPGSLYVTGGRLAASTRDLRASEVGDIVTILVNDNASAAATGATNTSRKSSANSSIKSLAGPTGARLSNLLAATGAQQLQGLGQTSRNMTLTTNISARVTEVSSNGSLMVEGIKNIGVNSEKQTIVVRGMIRPSDLTVTNTVTSAQVANLSIQVNGKGVVGDAIRRPHFLYRLIMGLLPF